MILSMTGFGVGTAQTRDVSIEVSLKSLNGRFMEMRCHLPRELVGIESDIKKLLSEHLVRGTVDIYVTRQAKGTNRHQIEINSSAAKQFDQACRTLGKAVGRNFSPDISVFLAQPEVLTWRSKAASQAEKQILLKAIKSAIDKCHEERKREGLAVQKHLESMVKKLSQLVEGMQSQAEQARQELGQKLEERLGKAQVTEKVDSQRLAQELAIYLDRADVAEEIQRLKEHLKQCHSLIRGQEPPGKKLDFYTQELNREVNTIGSKSPLPKLTQLVVDAKSVIEQIKEQVQNIV